MNKQFIKTLHSLWSLLPEGHVKHFIRSIILSRESHPNRRLFINRGDTVFQVGATNSSLIEWTVSIIGSDGKIVVIEPEERNFARITSSSLLSKDPRVTLLNRAAWSRREHLMLTVSDNPVDNKIAIDNVLHDNDFVPNNYVREQATQADMIDNIADELGINSIDFAEIHVNGAELEVLKGMVKMLPATCRLHIKAHALIGDERTPLNQPIREFLETRGYKTVITVSSEARQEAVDAGWAERSGDLYAWNPKHIH